MTGSPGRRILLLVLTGAMLLDALEVSSMVVATPAVAADLDLSAAGAGWLVTAFAAGFAATLVLGGRLVSRFGRRRVYLTALVVFAAASIMVAFVDEVPGLVVSRLVKGGCAALTAPTGLAIIMAEFRAGHERDRAVAVYTVVAASGFTAGLLLAGWLTPWGWRVTMAVPAPAALVLAALGASVLPRQDAVEGRLRWSHVAVSGAVLLGLLGVLGTVSLAPSRGWRDPIVWAGLVVAVAVLAGAVRVGGRGADPLYRRQLLVEPTLRHSMVVAGGLNGSYLGLLLTASLATQRAGWSPMQTAAAFLPASVPLLLTALRSQQLIARWGAVRLVAIASVLPLLAYVSCLVAPVGGAGDVDYVASLLVPMVVVGAAFVVGFAALNARAVASLPLHDRGDGAALYQTAVQVAAALVPAVVVSLYPDGDAVVVGLLVVAALVAGVGLTGLGASHDPAARRRPVSVFVRHAGRVPTHREGNCS